MALGVALMLARGLKGIGFYRTVFYIPSLLGSSVALAIIWKYCIQIRRTVKHAFTVNRDPWA